MNKEALKSIYAYNMLFNTSSGTNNVDEDVKFNTDLISDFDLQNFDAKRFEYYTTLLKTFDNDRDTLMNVLNKYNSVKSLRVKERKLIREIKDYVNKINSANSMKTTGGKKKMSAKDRERRKKALERIDNSNKPIEPEIIARQDEPVITNKMDELIKNLETTQKGYNKEKHKYFQDFKDAILYFIDKKGTDFEVIEDFEKKINDFEEAINSNSVSGGGFISDDNRNKFIDELNKVSNLGVSTTIRLTDEILSQARKIIELARKEVKKAIEYFDNKDKELKGKNSYFKKKLLNKDFLREVLDTKLNAKADSKIEDIGKLNNEYTRIQIKVDNLEKYAEEYMFFSKLLLEHAKQTLDTIEDALALLPSTTRTIAEDYSLGIHETRNALLINFKLQTKETHTAIKVIKDSDYILATDAPAKSIEKITELQIPKILKDIEDTDLGEDENYIDLAPAEENKMKEDIIKRSNIVNIALNYVPLVYNKEYTDIPNIIYYQKKRELSKKNVENAEEIVSKIEIALKNIKDYNIHLKKKNTIITGSRATITSIKTVTILLEKQTKINNEYKKVDELLEEARYVVTKALEERDNACRYATELDNVVVPFIGFIKGENINGKITEAQQEAQIIEELNKKKEEEEKKERRKERNEKIKKLDEEKKERDEERDLKRKIEHRSPSETISVMRTAIGRIPPLNRTSSSHDSSLLIGGANAEEKYSDDTLKAQYLDKKRYSNISPIIKDEFRSVKDEKNGKLVRIKTDNKIDQLSNDIETYNALSIQDREANTNNIIKKIKDFENDPLNPLEELEITLDDRIVFIIATFFIRYITILMVQWCIDINIIKSFYEGFIYYAIIYIILFWFVVLFINIDNSYDVKYMNFNGIINSIRSLFYYFYMGTNGISRLLIHTSLILLLIVIPIILNIKKKPEFKDEANDEDDRVESAKILNYEERKQLSKTWTLFTMFIWLFTSIIATKF